MLQDKKKPVNKSQVLNAKEKKKFFKQIEEQWAVPSKFFSSDNVFMLSTKNRIYLINRDFEKIDITKLKIDSMGVYFATTKAGEFRLSIEGSQIIGPAAKKNVFEIDSIAARKWMQGQDLEQELPAEDGTFVILKNKSDYIGCGKYKQKKILNFVPKTRRVNPL